MKNENLFSCSVMFVILFSLGLAFVLDWTKPTPAGENKERTIAQNSSVAKDIRDGFVIKVVDGDTLVSVIELGYDVLVRTKIRLARVNTPELNSADETWHEACQEPIVPGAK